MTRQSRHSIAPLAAESDVPTLDAMIAAVAARIAEEQAAMAAMVAAKPTAADGHSDGVRVRYVRAETTAAILADVLAMLERNA